MLKKCHIHVKVNLQSLTATIMDDCDRIVPYNLDCSSQLYTPESPSWAIFIVNVPIPSVDTNSYLGSTGRGTESFLQETIGGG